MDRMEEDTMLREIGMLYLRLISRKDVDETPGNNTTIQLHRLTDKAIASGLPRSKDDHDDYPVGIDVDW